MSQSLRILCGLCLSLFFIACGDMKDKKTTLEVIDNQRHYYPIVQGQELDIVFPIKNVGEHPFVLDDIIITCGCLALKRSSVNSIPAGSEGHLILTYDSTKNIGYVEHYITLYGNFLKGDKLEITFDVNVVPDAHYTKDYEELYQIKKDKNGGVKQMVEGGENNKGYYLKIE